MHFNGTFGLFKACPWEQRLAEIYCLRVKGVYRLIELKAKVIFRIKSAGLMDENLCKITVGAPVSVLISLGQRCSRDFSSDAHMIEIIMHCTKTADNVARLSL